MKDTLNLKWGKTADIPIGCARKKIENTGDTCLAAGQFCMRWSKKLNKSESKAGYECITNKINLLFLNQNIYYVSVNQKNCLNEKYFWASNFQNPELFKIKSENLQYAYKYQQFQI